MYTRSIALPDRSFFLFGPRGTGKTTWLRAALPKARWFDLLRSSEYLRLLRSPASFRAEVAAMTGPAWIVVDEVQKLPLLLDEVHSLLNEFGTRYRFALTGSSARKLKRGDVNLLAGRAINRKLFPLTARELDYDFDLDDLCRHGALPAIRAEEAGRVDYLEAYAANYLKEEVQQEALARSLDSFTRFLEVAALSNAQVTSVAGIARDAGVARPTVQGYFSVLEDTLLGSWLPAWRPRAKIKEVAHPKFYFFDPGVTRALAGRLREPLDSAERGHLLETLVLNELRAAIAYSGCGGELSYWRTPSGTEVDFVWARARTSVGIEVKSSPRWRPDDGRALETLVQARKLKRAFLVYTGDRELKAGPVRVLPYARFTRLLSEGAILD